ncbi:MAG: tRNA-intron lyase [Nanoarchaeota archaeon]|nr:tRNA-intron lyase [Nanoarchaeota archaeon]
MVGKKQKKAKSDGSSAKETEIKNEVKSPETKNSKEKVEAIFLKDIVKADFEGAAKENYDSGRFGEYKDNEILYSLVEAMFLLEKGKMNVMSSGKDLDVKGFMKNAIKSEPNFWVKYCVFKDMRTRGYVIKTALKFGADFRVYERGVKPGEDHAKWILYPVSEGSTLTWHEFSSKNRVAHSTRKKLLIGAVDNEGDVTYWQVNWIRP